MLSHEASLTADARDPAFWLDAGAPLTVGEYVIQNTMINLKASEESELIIDFTPIKPTSYEARFCVITDTYQPYLHVLTGSGVVPDVSIISANPLIKHHKFLNFEPQNPTHYVDKQIILRNNTAVGIPFKIELTDNENFEIDSANGVLDPLEETPFIVTFRPYKEGFKETAIDIILTHISLAALHQIGVEINNPASDHVDWTVFSFKANGICKPFEVSFSPMYVKVGPTLTVGAPHRVALKLSNTSINSMTYSWDSKVNAVFISVPSHS